MKVNNFSSKIYNKNRLKSSPKVKNQVTFGKDNVSIDNTKPDKKFIKDPRGLFIGGAFGTALGAGLGSLVGNIPGGIIGSNIGSLIGGSLGAATGSVIGNKKEAILYDLKALKKWSSNATQAIKGETIKKTKNLLDKTENIFHQNKSNISPLKLKNLKASDKTGETPRKYDSYDSSRDIFALYTKEGEKNENYNFQVEMAHLRPSAQREHLDLYMTLDWGKESQKKDLPFNLKGDNPKEPWKLAVKIDNKNKKETINQKGEKIENSIKNIKFSDTFSNIQFQLNKDSLRKMGWKDGEPLRVKVISTKDNQKDIVDKLSANTDNKNPQEILGKNLRWEGKSIYYAITDRFKNSDKTNDAGTDPKAYERFHGGDWQGIIDKLDYIEDLGVNALWISCPYENNTDFFGKDGFHGYWPNDFKKTDPHFGDMKKLKELVEKAHDKDIKVILDVVVNHTGYKNPKVTDPKYKEWFNKEGNLHWITQHHMENSALAGLPDLNQNNPEVSHFLIDAHKFWINQTGVDGFRMDAVRHVPEKFLREFNQEMHKTGKDFFTVGESFWLDSNFNAGYQNRTIDSIFDFPLAFAIRDSFSSDKTRSYMERLKLAKEAFKHSPNEVKKLIMPIDNDMNKISNVMKKDKYYDNPKKLSTLIDNHDMTRFMSDTGGDKRQLIQGLSFLFASRGIPTIYYGTEVGMEGRTAQNRNDMEWGKNPEITQAFKSFTNARNNSLALQIGNQKELHVNKSTYAFSRMRPEEEVVCVFNNSEEEKAISFSLDPESCVKEGAQFKDMLSDYKIKIKDGKLNVDIPPKGYYYLQWKDK